MNKRDQLAVENFVSTGMDLETLYSCFQDFTREEIAEIYNSYQGNKQGAGDTSNSMSINCSQPDLLQNHRQYLYNRQRLHMAMAQMTINNTGG